MSNRVKVKFIFPIQYKDEYINNSHLPCIIKDEQGLRTYEINGIDYHVAEDEHLELVRNKIPHLYRQYTDEYDDGRLVVFDDYRPYELGMDNHDNPIISFDPENDLVIPDSEITRIQNFGKFYRYWLNRFSSREEPLSILPR